MPRGIRKLAGSETFWCCVFWVAAWAALTRAHIDMPLELVLTVCCIHGLKEGAGKIGAGLASRRTE